MEISAAQIQEGMIFYGVKSVGDYPEFSKFVATKATAKQVKAKRPKKIIHGSDYEYTLRSIDWRYFSDFSSAREVWVVGVLDRNINLAASRLEDARKRKQAILSAEDIE